MIVHLASRSVVEDYIAAHAVTIKYERLSRIFFFCISQKLAHIVQHTVSGRAVTSFAE